MTLAWQDSMQLGFFPLTLTTLLHHYILEVFKVVHITESIDKAIYIDLIEFFFFFLIVVPKTMRKMAQFLHITVVMCEGACV